MVNKAGKTVTADSKSLAASMEDFGNAFDDKLTATIVDAPGEGSWPISTYTYLILHTRNMTDCTKAEKLLSFINWALTDPAASKRASDLGYATLPESVRGKVIARLGEVTCQGKPVQTK